MLVTQDFMHSPQRMQVRRNSVSGSAPGGRMSCRLPWRRVKGVWSDRNPKVSPPPREETNPRRERSKPDVFAHPGKGGGKGDRLLRADLGALPALDAFRRAGRERVFPDRPHRAAPSGRPCTGCTPR